MFYTVVCICPATIHSPSWLLTTSLLISRQQQQPNNCQRRNIANFIAMRLLCYIKLNRMFVFRFKHINQLMYGYCGFKMPYTFQWIQLIRCHTRGKYGVKFWIFNWKFTCRSPSNAINLLLKCEHNRRYAAFTLAISCIKLESSLESMNFSM